MTIEFLRENNLILFESIVGSQAYGTNTSESDRDIKGIFCAPQDMVYGFDYIDQVSDAKNDVVFYELKKFFELLRVNNPTILELLNMPDECIVFKHPLFDKILEHKEKFITKLCRKSFGSYASQQIVKAKGLNKKQNWEKSKIERKTVLDFCFTPFQQGSICIKDWLKERNFKQENCGLVSVPNMRYVYSVFYDSSGEKKYKGIVSDEEKSNDISLSSIPDKNAIPICVIQFNKDFYSVHCKDYREYQIWLQNRNVKRYVETKEHGQKTEENSLIDGKNMLHCKRLLQMAREIAEGRGIVVKRKNAQELLSIKRGYFSLTELITWAEKEINGLDELYKNSTIPEKVNVDFCNELLVDIRKGFYK